jgi:predicted kinase
MTISVASRAMGGFPQTASDGTDHQVLRSQIPTRIVLQKPSLILIMGVAGSGKTTLANAILRHIWAVYLDNNQIVDAFFPHSRRGKNYEELRPNFYRALYRITAENLGVGNSVVLDVPHIKEVRNPRWQKWLIGFAKKAGVKLIVVRCHCAESVLRARLKARGERRDRWKLSHWRAFVAEQPSFARIPFPHLDINTERDLPGNLRLALRFIRQASASH